MLLRKTYHFETYNGWDHQIYLAGKDFSSSFNVHPNILLSSEITLKRIDLLANVSPENIHNDDGENPPKYQHYGIDGFNTDEWDLDFCIKNDLGDDLFILIYDSDPSDDGEPIPEEDTKISIQISHAS